jgi:hypothetical protein
MRSSPKGKEEMYEIPVERSSQEDNSFLNLNWEEREFVAEALEVDRHVVDSFQAQPAGSKGLEEEPIVVQQLWACPMRGCPYRHKELEDTSKSAKNARNLHLGSCVERHIKQLNKEDWTREQIKEEVQGRIDPAFLERERKKWCPGVTCISVLAKITKHHKKCGWNMEQLEIPAVHAAADLRPSDLIEAREPASPPKEINHDVFSPNMEKAMEVVNSGDLPSLTEVAVLPKFVYNPCNRPLHPSLSLLWTQALNFTVHLILQSKNLAAAWSLWFMLAPCTLSLPTNRKGGKSEWQLLASDRLRRWLQGDFLSLWNDAVVVSEVHSSACEIRDSEPEQQAIHRAKQLIRSGRFADAAKALLADQPTTLSPDTIATLRDKFPFGESISDDIDMSTAHRVKVEPLAVEANLQSFPRGSSAGLSGIWPELLLLARRYSTSTGIPIVEPLSQLVEVLVNGEAPSEVAPWIIGGRLVPIGEKARPIVVSDVLGRLTSKIALSLQSNLFPEIFRGLQGGVGESCAADRTIHMLFEDLASHSQKLDWGVLAVDFRNGFNEANRLTIADELADKCPGMLPWFYWSYGSPIELVLKNGERIQGSIGVGQGDPASPFLFSVNLQPVLVHVLETWGELGLSIIRAFLDDGIFSGPVAILKDILMFLQSDEVRKRGLHVRLDKCALYIPNAGLLDTVHRDYGLDPKLRVTSDGIVVLGVPVGSWQFCDQFLRDVATNVDNFHNRLKDLDSPQLALLLLRMCAGATKVAHILRCLPPDLTASLCRAVDESMDQQLLHIMDLENRSDLTEVQWMQLHLPLSMSGLGLTKSSDIKEAAYLASILAVNRDPKLLQSMRSVIQSCSVDPTIQTFNTLVAESDRIGRDLFSQTQEKMITQRELTARVHRRSFDLLLNDGRQSKNDLARIKDQSQAGSSAWMTPVFSRSNLVIPREGFQLLLKRHIGFRFFSEEMETKCSRNVAFVTSSRKKCKEIVDGFLSHATEFCKNSFAQRHNSLAAELRQICNMAGVECMTEVQCIPGSTDVPADIYIHNGPGGVPLAVDTSVATPLSATILRSFHVMSKPGACTRNRELHKIGRYKEQFDSVNGSIQYLPFVMSTFGASGLLARRLLLFLSQKLSGRWGVPSESARRLVQNRISSGLMKYAAISLSRALSNHESQLLSA